MKNIILVLAFSIPIAISAQAQNAPPKPPPSTLKGVLLEQLRSTHNSQEWFATGNTAIAGLTADQAKWTDGKGNHSVGQLTYHLVFWNKEMLAKFKGDKKTVFNGNNDETFNNFTGDSPAHPTVFECFRNGLSRPATDAWVISPSNGGATLSWTWSSVVRPSTVTTATWSSTS